MNKLEKEKTGLVAFETEIAKINDLLLLKDKKQEQM